jgi:hypothetical protein
MSLEDFVTEPRSSLRLHPDLFLFVTHRFREFPVDGRIGPVSLR